jgi:predicted CXXCH cytochrome family protein
VKDGKCGTCHEPHGGSLPWMLTASYPQDLYAGFDEETYELCLVCHSADAFTEATSDGTGFRHGDRNMHFLHVNRPEKGRSCQVCHSAHAAGAPKLVRKEVPFGNWKLPVGFEATPTGGTCTTGCHKPLTYSRESVNTSGESEGEPSEEAPEEGEAGGVAPRAQ